LNRCKPVRLSLPIGTYDKYRSLNLGNNRWQNDLQVDFTQGFLDRSTVDVSGDWMYYGNNNEAGTANQRLSQPARYQSPLHGIPPE
jgi:hypothetical protein